MTTKRMTAFIEKVEAASKRSGELLAKAEEISRNNKILMQEIKRSNKGKRRAALIAKYVMGRIERRVILDEGRAINKEALELALRIRKGTRKIIDRRSNRPASKPPECD